MGGSLASGRTPGDSRVLAAHFGRKSVLWHKSAHAPETAQEFLCVSWQKSLPEPNYIHPESQFHISKTVLRADRVCSNLHRPSVAHLDAMKDRVTSSPSQEPQQRHSTHCFHLLQKCVSLPNRRFFPRYPARACCRSHRETKGPILLRDVAGRDLARSQIHSGSRRCVANCDN